MIKFTKMEGLGNDYIYIDCISDDLNVNDISKLAKFVSNRHFGIGSDGLILICKSKVADIKMRMFNSDGTEAEMCGNGVRCVGKLAYDNKIIRKDQITIETLAGIKTLKLHIEDEKANLITVDMGEPILEPKDIPVISNNNKLSIKKDDSKFVFTCISMGNPHAVTIVNNVEKIDVEKYGPLLENDCHFPKKANIEFVQIIDETHIKMRVWERGAGETYACGTGACAVCVACCINGLTKRSVDIELLGGNLQIEWNKENNHIYMTGPAKTICKGEFEYDNN